jgi:hypothetical protein
MKTKMLFVAMFILLATVSHAQTEKGRVMIGATTSNLAFAARNGFSNFYLNISPHVGYFLIDNLAIGTRLGFGYNSLRNNGQNVTRGMGIGVGVYGRYYVPLTDRFKLPIDAEIGLVTGRTRSIGFESNYSQLRSHIAAGIAWFMTNNASLELLLGYHNLMPLSASVGGAEGSLTGQIGFSIFLDPKGNASE